MAFQAHQLEGRPSRTRFLTVGGAYHGDTIGSVSLGAIELFHRVFGPLLFDTLQAPAPYCHRCPLSLHPDTCAVDCAASLETLALEHAGSIAAIVVEPLVQGAAGMITQPKGWLRRVADVADRIGAYLIVDEVAVGFGRTGTLFACEQEDVVPDFLCLAKGLTGGYLPVAATLTTDAIFDAFAGTTFFHGHTYTGNALGCAAALATIEVLERERIVEQVPEKAAHLAAALARLDHPAVADIRQSGLAVGIELETSLDRAGQKVCLAARDRGVFLRPLGNVIVLMPALSFSRDELDRLVDAVAHGIGAVLG